MNRRDVIALVSKATDGLAQTLTDTLLFLFFLYGSSFYKRGPRGIYELFQESESELSQVNYQSIKRAINKLTEKQRITRSDLGTNKTIHLTPNARQYIQKTFPSYRMERPWDGHVYLIAYDIPSHANSTRNMLRGYIKGTGGAPLQESLWINPYNPQQSLHDFAKQKHIEGTILVSKLGKDGAVGTERFHDLIARVYKFSSLSERYQHFVRTYNTDSRQSLIQMALSYHGILKDDPQLPFALEPENLGAKDAYLLYQSRIRQNLH